MSERAIVFCIVAVFAVIALWTIDYLCAKKTYLGRGEVVDRSFTPSSVGTGTTSDGKVVTTYNHEEWSVVAKYHGELIRAMARPGQWEHLESGSSCRVYQRRGLIGGYEYILEAE